MQNLITQFGAEIQAIRWLEWSAFATALIYVYYEARANIWCWAWGFVAAALTMWVCWEQKLFSDAALQVYYMAIAVYGFWNWRKNMPDAQQATLSRTNTLPATYHLAILVFGTVAAYPLGLAMKECLGANLPFFDAILATFSIIATLLSTRLIADSWYYWIGINFAYILLYAQRHLLLFALLSLIYGFFSIKGLINWNKKKGIVK